MVANNIQSNPLCDAANKLFEGMKDTLEYLASRWQDEKEYEDWADYDSRMVREMKELAKKEEIIIFDVKSSKRPFGVQFKCKRHKINLICNNSKMGWKAKPI